MLIDRDTLQEQGDSMINIVEVLVGWNFEPFVLLCILLKTSDVHWNINFINAVSDPSPNIKKIWWETG